MELMMLTWEMVSKGHGTRPGFTTRRFAGLELFQSLPVLREQGTCSMG